eukprot:8947656-Prorocentrum_lima.AAC.1
MQQQAGSTQAGFTKTEANGGPTSTRCRECQSVLQLSFSFCPHCGLSTSAGYGVAEPYSSMTISTDDSK